MNACRKYAVLALLAGLAAASGYVLAANLRAPMTALPTSPVRSPATARFVTYNIVHGTGMPIPPSLVRADAVEANVQAIGGMLLLEHADVVAVQETCPGGGPSGAENLAKHSGFPYFVDDTVGRASPRHGVALLSSVPLERVDSLALVRGVTGDKGWLAATVTLDALGGREVRVVALHLDPFSASTRERQVDQIAEALAAEDRAMVVMGDFNCRWEQGRCVQRLAERLSLAATPTDGAPTYRWAGLSDSLDWVLVSRHLRIVATRVLTASNSDHRPVVVDVTSMEKS